MSQKLRPRVPPGRPQVGLRVLSSCLEFEPGLTQGHGRPVEIAEGAKTPPPPVALDPGQEAFDRVIEDGQDVVNGADFQRGGVGDEVGDSALHRHALDLGRLRLGSVAGHGVDAALRDAAGIELLGAEALDLLQPSQPPNEPVDARCGGPPADAVERALPAAAGVDG